MAKPQIKLLFTDRELLEEKLPVRKPASPERVRIYQLQERVSQLTEKMKLGEVSLRSAKTEIQELETEMAALRVELDRLQSPSILNGLPWFISAALASIATAIFIPSDCKAARWMGFSFSVVIAAIGVVEAVAVPREGGLEREVGVINLSGFGVIRPQ